MESPEYILLGSEIDRQIRELSYKSQSEFDELCICVIEFFIGKINNKFDRAEFISRLPDKFMKQYQCIYKRKLKNYLYNQIDIIIEDSGMTRVDFLSKIEESDKKHLLEAILDQSLLDLDYYDNAPLIVFIDMLEMIGGPIRILSQYPEAFNVFDVINRMQVVDYLKKIRA